MKPTKPFSIRSIIIAVWIFLLGMQICCNLPQVNKSLIPQPFQQNNETDKTTGEQALTIQENILSTVSEENIANSIKELSGEVPVTINGEETFIKSRYSYAMFLDYPEADVLPYLIHRVSQWVTEDQIEIDTYNYTDAERTYSWKNLIITIPGSTTPEEKILLIAHYDSIVVREGNALIYAPGADDNATGTAVLLEAVRVFSKQPFEKTIEIVFFSGEEEGAYGSRAYLEDHEFEHIKSVINVDMIGYDSDSDGCVEIHAGSNPSSQNIALVLQEVNTHNNLNLQTDILTTTATDRSDHASFWSKNIPAVLVMENFFDTTSSGICTSADPNPNYHLTLDTINNINIPYVQQIAHMVLLSTAEMAIPIN
jgi:hypothetical protein